MSDTQNAQVEIIGRDSPEHRFSSRSIRSFVLRQGRMSEAQQRYLDDMLPKIGIDYRVAPLDLDQAFGRKAPKILEIGFGMGETTAKIAAAMPDHDFLGIEVHTPGVGALCKLIAEGNLSNLRIMQHDAVEVMRDMIADGTLAGVHLFFPDPWRKKRHFKRRIVQALLYETFAVAFVAPVLSFLFGQSAWSTMALTLTMSSIALAWNCGFNFFFERWEARQPVNGRSRWRRAASASKLGWR